MKLHRFFFIILFSGLMLFLLIYGNPAMAQSHENIYQWVYEEMEVSGDYPIPEIIILPKKELQKILKKQTDKSYKRMTEAMGHEEASRMVDRYLKHIMGLYITESRMIYVHESMERCKQNAVIAHEIVHYLQNMEYGIIDPDSPDAHLNHFSREFAAEHIEERFYTTFCGAH